MSSAERRHFGVGAEASAAEEAGQFGGASDINLESSRPIGGHWCVWNKTKRDDHCRITLLDRLGAIHSVSRQIHCMFFNVPCRDLNLGLSSCSPVSAVQSD